MSNQYTHSSVNGKALGALPEDKTKLKLPLAPFINTATMPAHPTTDEIPELQYDMLHNDQVGCCVVAGLVHALQVTYTLLTGDYVVPHDGELLNWYQSQNPGFRNWVTDAGGPNDNGMVIAEFLNWAVQQGIILGFAKVDHTNVEQFDAALYLFLHVITGETVQASQMQSNDWVHDNSPEEGGHCTVNNMYMPLKWRTVTWGSDDYTMEESFMLQNVSEAYVVLTQAHVDHPGFRNNFDLAKFSDAVKVITNGKIVIPVTPIPPVPPAPSPQPTPVPVPPPVPPTPIPPNPGGGTFRVNSRVASRIHAAAVRAKLTDQAWVDRHWETYFPPTNS